MKGTASTTACCSRRSLYSMIGRCGAFAGILGASIAACGDERPALRAIRPVMVQAPLRIQGTVSVSMNGMVLPLHVEDTDAPLAEDGADFADESGAAPQWQTIRFDDNAFQQAMFGGDREASLHKLEEMLARKIGLIGEAVSLTNDQRQKLLLAGRGDIHHLVQRIDAQSPRFEQVWTVRADETRVTLREVIQSLREASSVRMQLRTGPFGPDSLFEKNLRRLVTPEAYAGILAARKRDAPAQAR